jgi:hypothetical protein
MHFHVKTIQSLKSQQKIDMVLGIMVNVYTVNQTVTWLQNHEAAITAKVWGVVNTVTTSSLLLGTVPQSGLKMAT